MKATIEDYDQWTINYLRGVGVDGALLERVQRLAQEVADLKAQRSAETGRCMKCRTAAAVLTLSGNGTGYWHYCIGCTREAMYGNGDDLGPLALTVRYIYPFGGTDRSSLPADALALCR